MNINVVQDSEFEYLRKFLYDQTGIFLTDDKKEMLYSRLRKRIEHKNVKNISEYISILRENSQEVIYFINTMTTNKTDFFREPLHYDILTQELIPKLFKNNVFFVWSAASSTGEEPYTLSIVLTEHKKRNPHFDFRLLASDIDTEVLEKAQKGVYQKNCFNGIDSQIVKTYFEQLPAENGDDPCFRAKDTIREKLKFIRFNLLKDAGEIGSIKFDVIFLRNALIYFDEISKKKVISNVCSHLKKDGYLILGLSETIRGLSKEIEYLEKSVYRRL